MRANILVAYVLSTSFKWIYDNYTTFQLGSLKGTDHLVDLSTAVKIILKSVITLNHFISNHLPTS
jgi:hypothetical protein